MRNSRVSGWRKPRPEIGGEDYQGGKKRIFIGLLSITCVVICLSILIFFILPWFVARNAWLEMACISMGGLIIIILGWLCGMLIYHIHTRRNLPGINSARHVLIRVFLPLMEIIGKFGGIERGLVRRSFIKVNNELVLANQGPVEAESLLLLLPHCVQASKCPMRLNFEPRNCRHCGNCQVGDLLDLRERRGFRLAIASGGTIARKIVVDCRPKLIVAIACERDLASGIQDSYPLPVFGILNRRPHGPCRDTLVPLGCLENVLNHFLLPKYLADEENEQAATTRTQVASAPLCAGCQKPCAVGHAGAAKREDLPGSS